MIVPLGLRPRQEETQTTSTQTTITRTTTVEGSTSTPSSLLDSASSSLRLSWWQLLCIGLGGALVVAIGLWLWFRARRKSANEKVRAREIRQEEDKRAKEILQHRRIMAEGDEEGSPSEESDESDDDELDRKQTRETRRHRGRRRRRRSLDSETDDTSSESSETPSSFSDTGSEDHHRRRRSSGAPHRGHDRSRKRRNGRTPRRRGRVPSPSRDSPSPVRDSRGKTVEPEPEKSFRDSVFSSYTSMKRAAVKLKYVEAKVKLQKQLQKEEEMEQSRLASLKVQPPRMISAQRRPAVSDDAPNLHIPPVPVARRALASRSSTTSSLHLPTPPVRSYSGSLPNPAQTSMVGRSASVPAVDTLPEREYEGQSRSEDFQSSIQRLLNGPTREAGHNPHKARVGNDFQSNWLAYPDSGRQQQAPRSSIYVSTNHPKDRPTIPPGALQPAPTPKNKHSTSSHPSDVSEDNSGRNGQKWAERLRARR